MLQHGNTNKMIEIKSMVFLVCLCCELTLFIVQRNRELWEFFCVVDVISPAEGLTVCVCKRSLSEIIQLKAFSPVNLYLHLA